MTNLSPTALALMNLHRGGWDRVAEAVDALIAVTQEAREMAGVAPYTWTSAWGATVTLGFVEQIDAAPAPFTDPAP